MSIKIIKSLPPYFLGETRSLSDEDEALLVSLGFAEYLPGAVALTSSEGGDKSLTEEAIATIKTDPGTRRASAIADSVGLNYLQPLKTTAQPYKCAWWGDSRTNSALTPTGADCTGSGVLFSAYRGPTWVIASMGDAEYSKTYAVSGDQAVNWASASRSSGRTFIDLSTADADVVFIQYGVNDIVAGGKTAAQTAGYLQALIAQIFATGKLVVFESILPINAPIATPSAFQATIDATNALMQAWLANFPLQAVYIDTAATFKAGGTLASYAYIDSVDGIHPTRLGAQTQGQIIANGVRTLLPKRNGAYMAPSSPASNLISQVPVSGVTTQYNVVGTGSASVTQSNGQDENGFYYEWNITVNALSGNSECQVFGQISANFQTASPPYVSLSGNEILQGSARIVADDGSGGAPNAYVFDLRQRFYTGSIFNDWCGATTPPSASLDSKFQSKVDLRVHTPKLNNATASVVANPLASAGLQLQIMVQANALGFTRVRLYNPQIRRVGYTSTPIAVTPPASATAYTNNTNAPQQLFFAGGTVTSIAVNGVATGLTSGVFILNPADALTPTYSVAPTTFAVQQLMTQPSMRGLI